MRTQTERILTSGGPDYRGQVTTNEFLRKFEVAHGDVWISPMSMISLLATKIRRSHEYIMKSTECFVLGDCQFRRLHCRLELGLRNAAFLSFEWFRYSGLRLRLQFGQRGGCHLGDCLSLRHLGLSILAFLLCSSAKGLRQSTVCPTLGF